MPIDPLAVSTQVRQMGQFLVERHAEDERRLALARRIFEAHVDEWEELAARAEKVAQRVAVPTGPLDETIPVPPRQPQYTVLASDGSEVDPDRHGAGGAYYLINIGRARIPYGQPDREVELKSESTLGFTDEDLFLVDPKNPRRQVPVRDRHLDAKRTVEELRALADMAETEAQQQGDVPTVALVDGTLLFSVLEERPQDFLRDHFYGAYVKELDRLRAANVALAAYASRTRGIDLVTLFRDVCGGIPAACSFCVGEAHGGLESQRPRRPAGTPPLLLDLPPFPLGEGGGEGQPSPVMPKEQPSLHANGRAACAFRGLLDAQLLGPGLDEWDRSALFRVRSNVHDPYFGEHRVYFFLLDTGRELARVEVPEWVARDPLKLRWVHAVLADQCAKGMGYPAVLARADDRAVISTTDRTTLGNLVQQELARRGVHTRPSAKLGRKQVRTV